MPTSPRETVLCRYRYDPLDRLADCTPFEQTGIQRFYCKSRLATEIQGTLQCSIFQHDDQLLAQLQRQDEKLDTTLLATDQQRSVLNALGATQPHPLAYTPYGHRPPGNGLLSLLGFNGERPDPVTGHYHLGNGYRAFNPVLMRFNCPDSWSPFGEGGLNAYGYCLGDPINFRDPSGHVLTVTAKDGLLKNVLKGISQRSKSISKPPTGAGKRGGPSPKASSLVASAMTVSDEAAAGVPVLDSSRGGNDAKIIVDAFKRIKKNEPTAEIIGSYTARIDAPHITTSSTLFSHAKAKYPFTALPSNPSVYVPDVSVPRWTNTNQLDVHHFDVAISHFRNVAAVHNHLSSGSGGPFSILAFAQEIRRALYIKRHTGINLLR